jgi:hypothetical protein
MIINQSNFEYFHVERDVKLKETLPSTLIPEQDPYFLQNRTVTKDRGFCPTSRFFRGCIKITPYKEANK